MKLYNSLTKKIEEFEPLDKDNVRIYSCGPTVYDHAHIGNLSSYIYADTLRRVLELQYKNVTHVMNYTDVDDKTIKRSREKYPDLEPKDALKKLTDEYIELFKQDIEKVGIDVSKITFVRATDHIEDMKKLIRKLLEAKIAYITEDGVYFSIDRYKKTGKTYGQLLKISDSNTSSSRIDNDEYDKDSIHDFALWKKQKPGEPAWDFEAKGQNLNGRPGWHIECSAMSEKTLGVPFDIHTGGIDLIFPHHENEIAQSTGAIDGKVMAKYFVHNNHLLVDGKKMAKSANNFYTLQDIIDKGYDPLVFRLLVLKSHYRSESNFSWDLLKDADNQINNLKSWASLRFQNASKKPEHVSELTLQSVGQALRDKVFNDLNTPASLSILYDYETDDSSESISVLKITEEVGFKPSEIEEMIQYLDRVFGLGLGSVNDLDQETKNLISRREKARNDKNWEESDRLRDELVKQGIGIRDTDSGAIWYRL